LCDSKSGVIGILEGGEQGLKKSEMIFLGIFVLSLILILVCPIMVQWTFATVFEVGSPEKIIFLEQGRQNQEFAAHTS